MAEESSSDGTGSGADGAPEDNGTFSTGGASTTSDNNNSTDPNESRNKPSAENMSIEFGVTATVVNGTKEATKEIIDNNKNAQKTTEKNESAGKPEIRDKQNKTEEKEPTSTTGEIGKNIAYITDQKYLDKEQVTRLIRCGAENCTSYGPKDAGKGEVKEFEEQAYDALKDIVLKGEEFNPGVVPWGLLQPAEMGEEEEGTEKINSQLKQFIFDKEHEKEINQLKAFHLERFPDLKTPEQMQQNYIKEDYNYHYNQ